ncbi:agmatinase [bacterium CG_4_9_14_3_um_filter_65_15]|nr:MAG: agmatinase [bacterium CG_4_9_14_3_um_filter_65_15]
MNNPQNRGESCPFGGQEAQGGCENARFAVLPIPYDGTSTWQKGADKGPQAILAASAHMELYDIETDSEPWRFGIVTLPAVTAGPDPESMLAAVRDAARVEITAGRTVVGLGGEHSVSLGLIQACAEAHPGLSVLQMDAHSDTRASYAGSPLNHACVMARVGEICDFVQVGIRSMDVEEKGAVPEGRTFFAHDRDREGRWIGDVVDRLAAPVYVTIDLDVLDPAEMPSTGTPEPGGLSYREVVKLLRTLSRRRRIVGFDVVELMPTATNRAPDFLAARLVYQLMAYIGRHGRGE